MRSIVPWRPTVFLTLLGVCYSASAFGQSGSTLLLVKQGQPNCTVVVPRDDRIWTTKASEWLVEYIQKATGAKLSIVSEDQAPSGSLISVGHTKLAEKAGIDVSDLKWDGCKLIVKDNVLYLIGRDSVKHIENLPMVGAHGTCRAVLTFLEDHCGVRWFLPTPEGEVVPNAKHISVPEELAKTVIPAFAYGGGHFPYTSGFQPTGGDTPCDSPLLYDMGKT